MKKILNNKVEPKLDSTNKISFNEVIKRLRVRKEPIKLFGETENQTRMRLRTIEIKEDKNDGQKNDLIKHLDYDKNKITNDFNDKKLKRDFEDLDTSIITLELLNKDSNYVYDLLFVFFKRTLEEWRIEFDERSPEIKNLMQSKIEFATYKQTCEYLKPFLKMIKNKKLETDVLIKVTEICELINLREYVKANEAYMQLSIGNAAWPMGVTMVGIHARSARERINSNQVAHVLNDEKQRKWVQSIKRLMTFMQKKYPPEDISKCVG